jgi:hypothetical protein
MKRVLLLLTFVALALSACGGEPSPSPTPTPLQNQAIAEPTGTTPPALPAPETSLPDGTAPGVIAGIVTDQAGNPLTNAHVTIWGTTGAGANTYFEAAVDGDGRYAQPVPVGVYEIKAYAGIEYNDRHYNVWLDPVDGIDTPSQDAANGLTKDFELRLSGPKPTAKTRPNAADSYYGGVIDLSTEGQYYLFYGNGKMVEPFVYPDGAVVRVELTPNGQLLDGSVGEVITREIKGNEVAAANILDVPLGDYTVRASMVETDGAVTPLRVASSIPGGPFGEKIVPAESARAEFVPSRMGDYGVEPVELFIIPQ